MKKIKKIIGLLSVIIWGLFVFLPLITIIVGSFKTESEFYNLPAYQFATNPTFDNYRQAITPEFWLSLGITMLIVILTIIFSSIVSCGVAFVFERFNFKGRRQLMWLFWTISLMPLSIMQIFIFQVLTKIHLYDSLSGLVLLYSVSDIVIINIFREYIRKIPKSVDKNAKVSGASDWQIFWYIIFPNMRPAIMIVTIYKMMQVYNDFYLQFLYLPTKKTLSTYLYTFVSPYNINWPMICATVVILIIPVIIILIAMQWDNNKIINEIK